jgi:hypothetical protein
MSPVGDHSGHSEAGAPLRRAHRAAWFTFIFMAGTTMTFQTYHSVETGQMPWPLAALFGVAAFILAIMVLEFARHSPSRWVRGGAYALTAGAMYLSASATGDVVLHAAPPHASLLFGFLMDGAAILAIHFIFNGPTAAQAVAAVTQREAELLAKANAERSSREQSEADLRGELSDLRARAGREIEALRSDHVSGQQALESAQQEAAGALARADDLARRLAEASTRKKPAKAAATVRSGSDDDLSLEMRALNLLVADPELRKPRMGGELARKLDVSPATGRRLHAKLSAQDLPDSLSDTGR